MTEERLGAIIVSVVATLTFAAVLAFWLLRPPGSPSETLNVLVGALTAGYLQTINFWFGSSSGSKNKDQTISNLSTGTK